VQVSLTQIRFNRRHLFRDTVRKCSTDSATNNHVIYHVVTGKQPCNKTTVDGNTGTDRQRPSSTSETWVASAQRGREVSEWIGFNILTTEQQRENYNAMHRKAPVTAAVENYICITFLYNDVNKTITSCARGDTICPAPCKLTVSLHLFTRAH